MNSKEPALYAFIDLSKAFGIVYLKTLIEKLQYYDISGKTYVLISSYLSARLEQISINGTLNEPREVQMTLLFFIKHKYGLH